MSGTILTAVGLVLAIEGLTYALVPAQMKTMMAQLQNLSVEQLRITGTSVLALGVGVIWIAHSLIGG
jgi:uncharacterized protein